MDPVNPRHGLRCTADASPFAIVAGREALCCDHLNLAYSINPDCSCPAGAMWRRQIGFLWERLSQLVDLGLLFSAVARGRHPGDRTQCGQSPLHHSICLPTPVHTTTSTSNYALLDLQWRISRFAVYDICSTRRKNRLYSYPSIHPSIHPCFFQREVHS